MSVNFYDEALINKIHKWTANTDIQVYGPDETVRLFETLADKRDDSPIQMPLICLVRKSGYAVNLKGKQTLTYNAITVDKSNSGYSQLNAIPITLSYQIDVYTRYRKEAEEYMRNILFNIVNCPRFDVSIPYESLDAPHVANINIGDAVEDTSDRILRLSVGQFTCLSIGFTVDDAYLFDVRPRSISTIGFRISADRETDFDYNINPLTDTFPD